MENTSSKIKGFVWVAVACVVSLVFVFGLSPLAHVIPWSWEKKLANVFNSSSKEIYRDDSQAQVIFQKLVHRIYPVNSNDQAFSIDVQINKSQTVNAYAELGGKIFINSALINQAESPEEIAGVLAHEIEHVRHRHVLEGVITYFFTAEGMSMIFSGGQSSFSSLAEYFFKMNFSRTQEAMADKEALLRLQKAHVNNQGFKNFFKRIGKSSLASIFISDHPANQARLAMADGFNNNDVKPILTASEWEILKNIN